MTAGMQPPKRPAVVGAYESLVPQPSRGTPGRDTDPKVRQVLSAIKKEQAHLQKAEAARKEAAQARAAQAKYQANVDKADAAAVQANVEANQYFAAAAQARAQKEQANVEANQYFAAAAQARAQKEQAQAEENQYFATAAQAHTAAMQAQAKADASRAKTIALEDRIFNGLTRKWQKNGTLSPEEMKLYREYEAIIKARIKQ